MLSFTASAVLFVMVVIIAFVFKREFILERKVEEFPVKFPDDKDKVFLFMMFFVEPV